MKNHDKSKETKRSFFIKLTDMKKHSYLYILSSKKNGTIYIGVTRNLRERIFQHKQKLVEGFTSKYAINRLVYVEVYDLIMDAITREKQLKRYKREWKIALIEKDNPLWRDLTDEYLMDCD